ncbi:MAG: RNA 2'-phosphotransferase [Clostridia bacterium]|nr:RNA 2'-phosphotransferase [Clostridia bacterium]
MDYQELSKEVSYALRHAPWEYELELDENGWVEIDQLLDSLRFSSEWQHISEVDLNTMIAKSEKKRHEISNGKIRALYGHSIPHKIIKEAKEPPEILYHGTARYFVPLIKEKGLIPKGRQYVHLSVDVGTALQVGKRRDEKPVLLKVNAKNAWGEGVNFYLGNDKVWLADQIPSKYIDFE